jgi:hypothetical protein
MAQCIEETVITTAQQHHGKQQGLSLFVKAASRVLVPTRKS